MDAPNKPFASRNVVETNSNWRRKGNEENGGGRGKEARESVDVGGTSAIINDGRWLPPGDKTTARHNKKGDANFADGHVETIQPEAASDPMYTDPSQSGKS
jgi:prepilin-type processing-associated H-X9-DG protein